MIAPMPGGATRSGTFRRGQAAATSGVDRPANSVGSPARPGSIPVTRQTLPAATGTILNARAAPRFPAPRPPGRLRLTHSGIDLLFQLSLLTLGNQGAAVTGDADVLLGEAIRRRAGAGQ